MYWLVCLVNLKIKKWIIILMVCFFKNILWILYGKNGYFMMFIVNLIIFGDEVVCVMVKSKIVEEF